MRSNLNRFFLAAILMGLVACSQNDVGFQAPVQYGDLNIRGFYQMIGPESQTSAIWVKDKHFAMCNWSEQNGPTGQLWTGHFDGASSAFYFDQMPSVQMQAAGFDNAWTLHLSDDDHPVGDYRRVGSWEEATEYAPKSSVCAAHPEL